MIQLLDRLRNLVLQTTMKSEFLRERYVTRYKRHFWVVIFSLILNFLLCHFIPTLMLLLAPILFGAAHIFLGFRFVVSPLSLPKETERILIKIFVVSLVVLGGVRFLPLKLGIDFKSISGGLGVFLLVSALVIFVGRRLSFLWLGSVLLFVFSFYYFPLATTAVTVIGHNFVPFVFWMNLTQSSEEKRVAIYSLIYFTILHLIIFMGFTDLFVLDWWAVTSLRDKMLYVIRDPIMLDRVLRLYVFGQAIHYVLWLKIIPEIQLNQQVPLSFKQDKSQFVKNNGMLYVLLTLGTSALIIGSILFFDISKVREVYIFVSAGHGYVEIASLFAYYFGKPKAVVA